MELMVVKDVTSGKNGLPILTGPLLVQHFARRSEVEHAFGDRVTVSSGEGKRVVVPVRGVSVSQTMSGQWQVSVAIEYPSALSAIALESVVTDDR